MAPKDYVFLTFLIPTVVIILRVDNRMRIAELKRRLGIGLALLCATPLLFMTMMSLPKPTGDGSDMPIENIVAMAVSSIFAGAFILSVLLISGGLFQTFKRWRYYRKSGS